jgi:hypothetical protein
MLKKKKYQKYENTMDVKLNFTWLFKSICFKILIPVGSKSQISTKYYLLICISRQNSWRESKK